MQLQPLDMRVHRVTPEEMDAFKAGTLTIAPNDIVKFAIIEILEPADLPFPMTPLDIFVDEFSYSKLREYSRQEGIDMTTQEDEYIYWRQEEDVMVIGNDNELQDAIEIQQQALKWEADNFVRIL